MYRRILAMKTSKKKTNSKDHTTLEQREKWLFDNKTALRKVKKGLEESAQGQVVSRGSFTKWIKR